MLAEEDTGNSFSSQKRRRGNASASSSHTPASGAGRVASGTSEHNPKKCWKCGQEECLGKARRAYCNNSCIECGRKDCKGKDSCHPSWACQYNCTSEGI
jgi:hypothetical protein